jgi:hypothetical protein
VQIVCDRFSSATINRKSYSLADDLHSFRGNAAGLGSFGEEAKASKTTSRKTPAAPW